MKKLKNGSKGPAVKALQTALNKSPIKAGLKTDAIFGDKTEASVKAYQKRNRLKVDGIAGDKTHAALGLGAGGKAGASKPRKDKLRWPDYEIQTIIAEAAKRYLDVRASLETHLRIAEKTKFGDMLALKKALLEAGKQLDKALREQQKLTRILADLELQFMKAKRENAKACPGILKKAKMLDRDAAKAQFAFSIACENVNKITAQVAEIKTKSTGFRTIKSTTRKLILTEKKWRKTQQGQILNNMKFCASRKSPEFEEMRLRYLGLEAQTQKVFNYQLSMFEILANLEEMYNKAIPTKTSSELRDLYKRVEKQGSVVLSEYKRYSALTHKKHALDRELAQLSKQAA